MQARGPHHNDRANPAPGSQYLEPKETENVKRVLSPEEIFLSIEPPLISGSCLLKDPQLADLVQQSLIHFEGERYFLSAWCVMPNHVHVVVSPLGRHLISKILHSWKSYTAHEINRRLEGSGPVWERESFDHIIRTADHLSRFISYIENNPVAAGFCATPQDWPFSSAGCAFQNSPYLQIINPRQTPFAPVRSRGELPHLHKESGTYFVTFRLADTILIDTCNPGG